MSSSRDSGKACFTSAEGAPAVIGVGMENIGSIAPGNKAELEVDSDDMEARGASTAITGAGGCTEAG